MSAAFALGFFLVLPKYQEAQMIGAQAEEKIVEIQKRTDYYDALVAIADQLDQCAESYKKIETALPDNPDASALMSFAQAAAMQSGLAVKNISYSQSGSSSSSLPAAGRDSSEKTASLLLREYGVDIGLSGNYESLKNFLQIVEKSSRLITVKSINLQSEEKDDGENQDMEIAAAPKNDSSGQDDQIIDYEIKLSAHYYEQ